MPHIRYRNGELWCEQVPLPRIAGQAATPAYVYSAAVIRENYRCLAGQFREVPHTLCYSVKANSSLEILRLLRRLGAGFDIVSGGELRRVLQAGGTPGKVVFSGVGKTAEELAMAIRHGVLSINVESPAELQMVADCARRLRRRARVAVRVNPDVNPHTHRHISTGQEEHKFGIHWKEAVAVCERAMSLNGVDFTGIGCHIGSQITTLAPFEQAVERMAELADRLAQKGIPVLHMDFGGGVGIRYQKETTVSLSAYARTLKRLVRRVGCRLLLEPGRVIVGPAGVLLTRVVLEKKQRRRRFVVVDAAMNDFLRPALYGARHRILPVRRRPGKTNPADVVGPVCETGDCFDRAVPLPALDSGDLLAVMDVGAYGFVLASNYNSRPRPPEILVTGNRYRVIRRRETWRDEIRGET